MVLLITADVVFLGENMWLSLAGLLSGTFIGIGRFRCSKWILRRVLRANTEQSLLHGNVAFTLSQFVLLPVIALAYFLNIWVLYGLIAGLLIIPTGIMINSITEALGITKNNFMLGGD